MILDLVYIGLIVALVFLSGFWDNLDEYVNKKFGLGYHLPHLLQCSLCQTWWLSLLYVIIVGKLSLLNVMLCLINAHLSKIYIPLWRFVENLLLKIIEIVSKWVW